MGRKTENIDQSISKEKKVPGTQEGRTGLGTGNAAVIMGESRILGRKQVRLLAAGLSFALLVFGCQPVQAQEEPSTTYEQYISGGYREENDIKQYETLRITGVEELQDLAAACAYDVWSRDKRVLLEADLDLEGTELQIPVFGGIFDGQGHTISGLTIQQEGSQMGLFRYLQQGAVVQNLVISEARVLPQGSGCQTGILVGRNYGSIVNCQVSGVLEGDEEVGGIAGVNEQSGEIRSCIANVTVLGNRRSGGITGSNHGTLNNCTNKGSINIYTNDMVHDLEDFTVENLEEASSGVRLDAHMDTGGIAGISDGKIYYCTNAGTVGYAHVGYNVGGIVGRLHQGYIQNCTNTGHVLGRKDVGGITGQMEPFMEIEYIDGKLDELDRELDTFLDMLEATHDHMSSYGDQATAISRQLNANLRNVSTASTNLLNITNDLWHLYNQEISGISSDFDRLASDLKVISDKEKEEENKQQESEENRTENANQEGNENPEQSQAAAEGRESGWGNVEGQENSQAGEQTTAEGQENSQAGEQTGTTPGASDHESLGDRLEDWRDDLESVSGNGSIDWDKPEDWNKPSDWETPEYAQEYRNALSNFADSASSHLHKITDTTSLQNAQVSHNLEVFNLELKAAMDRLSDLTDTLDAAQGGMDADVDALVAQARKLRRLISEIRNELFSYEGITVNDTSDEAASEDIENIGAGEPETESQPNQTSQESQQPSQDQPGLEMETVQTGGTVTEKWYDTTSFQQGKITLCLNRGAIEADTCVGGIVGQISTEHDLDPEDDITFTGMESLTIQESIKAVVRESRNEGYITAKRNYVGGIAGKADFGAIISCESYANIQSTGGSYVGGIAGSSDYTIRSCFSTGFLEGKSYVGGIVGMGSEIYYCDAMNNLEGKGEKQGAIAGDLREAGMLYDNYYVSDCVAGIDGIGYGGGAIPLSYEEFSAREGLPGEFRQLTLHFVVLDEDGEFSEDVATLQVPYGGGLTADQLPDLPEKEGCYGQWPEIDYSHITESRVLAAEYTKWITALSAETSKSAEKQAAIMVEGRFYPEDTLEVTEEEGDVYHLQIHTAEGLYDQPVSVRLHQSLLPEHYEIRLWQEGKNAATDTRVMGSYVVFDLECPGSFQIVSVSPQIPMWYYIMGGGAILLALILVTHRFMKRRKAKQAGAAGQNAKSRKAQIAGKAQNDKQETVRKVQPAGQEAATTDPAAGTTLQDTEN